MAFIRLGRPQNFNGTPTPGIPGLCVITGDLAMQSPFSAHVQEVDRSSAARPPPEIPPSIPRSYPVTYFSHTSRTTRAKKPQKVPPVQSEIPQFSPLPMIPQWDQMSH